MQKKDTNSADTPSGKPLLEKNGPLVELRWKKWIFVFLLIVIIWCTWFSIFGAIIPYLTTGDFAEIWPAHEYHPAQKVLLFVFSWPWLLGLPFVVHGLRLGVISFYDTYVEQRPYIRFFKKITIPYENMHVKDTGRGIKMTNGSPPPWRENLVEYWKTQHWESVTFAINDMYLKNPECLPKAIKLARERAVKINKS